MDVLVTGGAGHIGSTLSERLVARFGARVTVADNLSTGSKANLAGTPGIELAKVDVNVLDELRPVFAQRRFDVVFHFAAVVGVQRTLAEPFSVFRDIKGIENIVALAQEHGAGRILFASSSEVYGEPFELPLRETTTPISSRLPYAIVKTLGEAYLKASQGAYGLETTVLRLFNTYGPRQSADFVVPRFLALALAGQPIPIYGDGRQTRTYCYVDDCVDACLEIVARDAFINDTVNVGSERETAVLELAELVLAVTGSRSPIVFEPALAEGDVRRRCPDTARMRSVLDREPIALEDGLRRMLAHCRTPSLAAPA